MGVVDFVPATMKRANVPREHSVMPDEEQILLPGSASRIEADAVVGIRVQLVPDDCNERVVGRIAMRLAIAPAPELKKANEADVPRQFVSAGSESTLRFAEEFEPRQQTSNSGVHRLCERPDIAADHELCGSRRWD